MKVSKCTFRAGLGLLMWAVSGSALADDNDLLARVAECERLDHGEPHQALDIGEALLDQLTLSQDPVLYLRTVGCVSWAQANLGLRAEAEAGADLIAAALDRVDSLHARLSLMRREAALRHRLGNLAESIDVLADALLLAEQHDERRVMIDLLTALGAQHSEDRLYDRAIAHYLRALSLVDPEDEPRQALPIRFNLGLTYRNAERFDEAVEVLEGLIEPLSNWPGMEVRLASLFNVLASIRRELGDFDAAEAYSDQAIGLHETLDNSIEYTSVLIERAYLSLARQAPEQALEWATQALAEARRSEFFQTLGAALNLNVRVLSELGRHGDALVLERERAELVETHLRERERSRLTELEARLGSERQVRELEQLRQARELDALVLQRQRLTIMLVAVIALFGVIALYWLRRTNRRLYRLSRTDPLTGLRNRRALTERLTAVGQDRSGNRHVVMLIDLDYFKAINDSHGHDTGDEVLVAAARKLEKFASRHQGVAGRWGGEEFALIVPVESAEQARKMAQTLGQEIASLRVTGRRGEAVGVSASIGFAPIGTRAPDAEQAPWEPALLIADLLLYKAKRAGRRRCVGVWPGDKNQTLHPRDIDRADSRARLRLFEDPLPSP